MVVPHILKIEFISALRMSRCIQFSMFPNLPTPIPAKAKSLNVKEAPVITDLALGWISVQVWDEWPRNQARDEIDARLVHRSSGEEMANFR